MNDVFEIVYHDIVTSNEYIHEIQFFVVDSRDIIHVRKAIELDKLQLVHRKIHSLQVNQAQVVHYE